MAFLLQSSAVGFARQLRLLQPLSRLFVGRVFHKYVFDMRLSYLILGLIVTAGLATRPSRAQRAPIAPLVPVAVPIRPVSVKPQRTVSVRIVDFPSITRSPSPLYLANSKIIFGDGALASINPQDMAKIAVYKGDNMPANWRTTPNNGVLDILLKKKVRVPSRSLTSLKRQLHLHGPVRFAIDGRPLPDASLRVATSAIGRLEVRPPEASGQAVELNILLTERPLTANKPGIWIRGTAGR